MNPNGPNDWPLFALEIVVKATLLLGGAAAVALFLPRSQTQRERVLFYEAAESGAQLDFSHNNRTSIVFVDGHVELCSREEATNLRWRP